MPVYTLPGTSTLAESPLKVYFVIHVFVFCMIFPILLLRCRICYILLLMIFYVQLVHFVIKLQLNLFCAIGYGNASICSDR